MKRFSVNDIVLKVLGFLLLTAAVLKGHELLTVPAANRDFWSWRPFLIFQVEFELALGIWLLSGVLKRLAWLAALTCFSLFCCVTLYKGLIGATSCGCFGRIHVNPWITLAMIDLPAAVLLWALRPAMVSANPAHSLRVSLHAAQSSWQGLRHVLSGGRWAQAQRPWSSISARPVLTPTASAEVAFTGVLILLVLALSTSVLAMTKPPKLTSRYAVLEPETWRGKQLPILPYIDIADTLTEGRWLVILHRHDCRACAKAIPQIQQFRQEITEGKAGPVRVALIQVPPHSPAPKEAIEGTIAGRLSEAKTWFVATPTVVCLTEGTVVFAEDGAFNPQSVLKALEQSGEAYAYEDKSSPRGKK